MPESPNDMLMGFYFSPRGGSAQVARYLCRSLASSRWRPTLYSGSLACEPDADARAFFAGIDCCPLDYSGALAAWRRGEDPMVADQPIHASYEDKTGVPDRIFFSLDDNAYERQASSWCRHLRNHLTPPAMVHLHHLTPMHEAVMRLWPDVPVITHLHGTELKMLARAAEGRTAPEGWVKPWVGRMQRWAERSSRIVVVSDHDAGLVASLLPRAGLGALGNPGRSGEDEPVVVIGNGVDTHVFQPRTRTAHQRMEAWRRWLVDEPLGWSPDGGPGSVRYTAHDLEAFTDPTGAAVPVVLFAGRFMAFKRLALLIEAHHRARAVSGVRSVLVIVGGFPGEWEGEHPLDTVRRLGAEDVFFVGWRSHAELAELLACSDVFAAPSMNEPFGLVYLEAMAAGVAPIAAAIGGPPTFINTEPLAPNGWLIEPDDLGSLTSTLVEAISDDRERAQRGANATAFVRANYAWARSAAAITDLYDSVACSVTPSRGVE